MTIRKAILPVAGLGTRFLPATKAVAKEMIPVVDKPVLQYVVEEAVAAGIREIIFVTHSSKRSIEDHFDTNYELESELSKRNKQALLDVVHKIRPKGVSFISIRQGEALGLGHAVLCAREIVGNDDFAVLLPDVLVDSPQSGADLSSMISSFQASGLAQIMVEQVADDRVDQYGIVAPESDSLSSGCSAGIRSIVEKPSVSEALSNLAVVGRYVLPAEIFELLAQTAPGAGGEIQLTDALSKLLEFRGAQAYRMSGKTYDCGSKIGYLEATLVYALKHPDLGRDFVKLIQHYLPLE